MSRTKTERLEIVLNISRQLKGMNLYDSPFPAILEIKKVMNEWVQQDDDSPQKLYSLSGKIPFPEMQRKIEYLLPIKKKHNPLFVLRSS